MEMTTDEMRIDLLITTFRYGRVNMGIRLGNITHGEFTALQMVHIYMKRNPDASGIGVSELARCSRHVKDIEVHRRKRACRADD